VFKHPEDGKGKKKVGEKVGTERVFFWVGVSFWQGGTGGEPMCGGRRLGGGFGVKEETVKGRKKPGRRSPGWGTNPQQKKRIRTDGGEFPNTAQRRLGPTPAGQKRGSEKKWPVSQIGGGSLNGC